MGSYALIFAGGVGTRMNNHAVPKQFLKMHGKEIIVHTIDRFNSCTSIDGIVVVCVESWIPYMQDLVTKYRLYKVISVVPPGVTGQESIFNGLVELERLCGLDDNVVLIHDGVRPIINHNLINNNIESVLTHGSAISASKVIETVVLADNGIISDVVNRAVSWTAKAPQSFYLKDILACHREAHEREDGEYIDSATLMKAHGCKLNIVECSTDNIKITTPTDFYIFRAIFDKEENQQLL